ncbi:hypothetical protein BCR34DRAFT_608127 [Clohesyomyces aquaticus]|uniref:Uncharacterized protein n=1 Tax=Clohesyomyces aquaticus TaxID=1231657 RepID=A0A1Y1YAA3_9PLEO|nr:hypothetical protein BCR34DRAFT_608127 [Clohesyomyces aquaticus]
MFNFFTSCFGGNSSRRGDGYGAGDSSLRSRRVLVRNSMEKESQSISYHHSSARIAATSDDEKRDLQEHDSLLIDFDEDAEERSTYISEKHLEAGVEGDHVVERRITEERRLSRKSVIFRPWKKSSKAEKGTTTARLLPHNTGDELHRRAEFERTVKKMNAADAERAWGRERQLREQWNRNNT